jgi:hypothetical protein
MRLMFALVLAILAIGGLVAGSLEGGRRRKNLFFRASVALLIGALVVAVL